MSPPYSFRTSDGELHVVNHRTIEGIAANGVYVSEAEAKVLKAQAEREKAKTEPTHISHALKQFLDKYPGKLK